MTHRPMPTEEALRALRLPELWARFTEVTGETSRCPNKAFLIRRILESLGATTRASAPDAGQADLASDAGQVDPAPDGESAARSLEIDSLMGVDPQPGEAPGEPTKPGRDDSEEGAAARVASEEQTADHPDEHAQDPVVNATDPPRADLTAPESVAGAEGPPGITTATQTATSGALEGASEGRLLDPDRRGEQRAAAPGEPPLRELSVAQLRERLGEVAGRPTRSHDRRYLMWKLRQVERGQAGPTRSVSAAQVKHKVLPVRMAADVVVQLDQARVRLGLASRMELFRRALHTFFVCEDEHEMAALFAPTP